MWKRPPELPPTKIKAMTPAESFEHRMAMHVALSEQIWREQNLVSLRMTWNLSFQAILVTVFTFAGSNLHGWMVPAVQVCLALAGLAVTVAIYFGVVAAQTQSGRLKNHWLAEFCDDRGEPKPTAEACNVVEGPFPQPFSPKTHSDRGRWTSRGICLILGVLWIALTVIAAVHGFIPGLDLDANQATCTIKRTPGSQAVSLDCPELVLNSGHRRDAVSGVGAGPVASPQPLAVNNRTVSK